MHIYGEIMEALQLNTDTFLYHICDILSHDDQAQSFLNLNARICIQMTHVKAAVSTAKCDINILWNLFWHCCCNLLRLFWIMRQKPNALTTLLSLRSFSSAMSKSASLHLIGEKGQPESKLSWVTYEYKAPSRLPWFLNQQIFFGCNYLMSDNRKLCRAQFMYSTPIPLTKSSTRTRRLPCYLRSAMCVASSKG